MATAAEPIFHLAYISQAHEELSYHDITEILNAAKTESQGHNIGGVLIHCDGYFIQLLEGSSESAVKQTLSRLITNDHHNNLRVIKEWHSTTRLFKQASIGFCDSDLHTNHSCFDFIKKLIGKSINFSEATSEQFIQFFIQFSISEIELK